MRSTIPYPLFWVGQQACTHRLANQLLEQEIGEIKNPLDDFYKSKSSTICRFGKYCGTQ